MLPINDDLYYLKGARILLIDDSKSFQSLTAAMLNKAGVASVTVADTLAEGMHLMNYIPDARSLAPEFDLVLMDIDLPDGNGIEGCRFISSHAATYNILVVVVSGASEPSTIKNAIKAGARDYLIKPLVAELLTIRLELLLKLRSLEHQWSQRTFDSIHLAGSDL